MNSFFEKPIFGLGLALACLAAARPAPAGAQPAAPVLVGDFAPGDRPANFVPSRIAHAGGLFYFSGSDPQHGDEPWVSDGTPAGTRMLADLCPGVCPGYPRAFTALGDRVVFLSYTNQALYAVENGQVEEIARGLGKIGQSVTVLGEVAYISGGANGESQWRTDGTAAGTRPTADFCAAPPSCAPYYPSDQPVYGGLYFVEGGGLHLLKGEGDRRRLADLRSLQELTRLDATRVVFHGCATAGCGAWVSDGSPAGTRPLETLVPEPGLFPARFFVTWQGRVYFAARGGGMMSSDGTVEGTRAEPSFGGGRPRPFAATPGALLYILDGATPEDTLRARQAGGGDVLLVAASPSLRLDGEAGGKVFFYSSQTLMATDGTPAGTHSLLEAYGRSPGIEHQGLYYFGFDPNGGELAGALWRSDGTPAGTEPIDFGKRFPNGHDSFPHRVGSALAVYTSAPALGLGPNLYFLDRRTFALTAAYGTELYPLALGRHLYYATALFEDDLVAASDHGAAAVAPLPFTVEAALAEDDHLFYAPVNRPGQKLFESDGTAAGTRELFDLDPSYVPLCHAPWGCDPSFPQAIAPSGDHVFFLAPAAGLSRWALWVWPRRGGAPRELLQVDELFPELVPASGGRVVFAAEVEEAAGAPMKLWTSDGTPQGTRPLVDLPGRRAPDLATRAGNRVFFSLPGDPGSLWVTDLTSAGTVQLMAGRGLAIEALVPAGDHVYFSGRSGAAQDAELGFSDGTVAGSRWLEVVPGPGGLRPQGLFVLDDQRAVFAGAGDAAGQELWISDGSLPGTTRLTDLAPGPAAAGPTRFAQVGNQLFFDADDGVTGLELWVLELPPARPACPAERLCLQNGRFEVRATALVPQPDGSRRRFAGGRALGREESGVFTFFSGDNWELLVKVLDACPIDGSYWVLASAASDIAYDLDVLDRATGNEQHYVSAAGAGRPILDLDTGLSCSEPAVPPAYSPAAPPAPAAARCPDVAGEGAGEQLCLGPQGRFRVELAWNTADGAGRAHPIAEGSADSGLFTFFSASNWEMMVKVLDGCAINGQFWVFGAGTTDVGWTLTVTDRVTARQKVYRNPLGQASPTIADSAAFACEI